MLHSQTRRRNRNNIASLEACESRLLLTARAIYPQPQITSASTATEEPETIPSQNATVFFNDDLSNDVQPSAVAADYAGSWNTGGAILTLSVKGNKVKGTATGTSVVGTAKIKGKLTDLQLDATLKGKANLGVLVGRAKYDISVTLTDSTHFEGTASGTVDGVPIPPTPLTATKL